MIDRRMADPGDPHPACDGLLCWVNRGAWDDLTWDIYVCARCGTRLAAVDGGPHVLNHVFSNESARRLADAQYAARDADDADTALPDTAEPGMGG